MAHTIHDKRKLLLRVRRIRGQLAGIETALEREQDCTRIMQTVAACRGALNSLMFEIIAGHVREHVLDPQRPVPAARAAAADHLLDVVKAYLK